MKRPLLLWRRRYRTASVMLFPTLAFVAMGTDANDKKTTTKRWGGGTEGKEHLVFSLLRDTNTVCG